MSRKLVISLDNNGNLNSCYYYLGKKCISFDNYLIKINRLLNSFDDVKYTKNGFNSFTITDKKVLNAFNNKIFNVNKSKENALKNVVIASSILGMLASYKIIDKFDDKDNIKDEVKPVSYVIHPNIKEDKKESDETYNFDFITYKYQENIISDTQKEKDENILEDETLVDSLYTPEEMKIIESENEITIDNYLYDDDAFVYSFDYTDRSENEKSTFAKENYMESVKKYSKMYGIDKKLVMAILTQENAYNEINNSLVGANGVMQIESIWYGHNISAYNFIDNKYDNEVIDKNSLSNPDYSIKIGTMILNNYYMTIYNNYVKNDYINKSEAILATILAYNKGITAVCNLINNYKNYFIDHINETLGGDNDYLKHVFSYLTDESVISIENIEDENSMIVIDNLTR